LDAAERADHAPGRQELRKRAGKPAHHGAREQAGRGDEVGGPARQPVEPGGRDKSRQSGRQRVGRHDPAEASGIDVEIVEQLRPSGASILIASHERLAGLDEAGVLNASLRVVVVGGESVTGKRRSFESLLGAERLLPADAPDDDIPAVMIYTSGTTSRPKGVVLSHAALSTGVRKYLSRVTLSGDDVALIGTSISRPLALRCQLLPTLSVGGRVSLLERFTVDSDRVPARLLESFERLTGGPVTEQCGSTETGPYAMNPPFGRKKPGSIGPPVHGVQVAIVDEHGADVPTGEVGDIRVSGPGVMDGSWNETAMTRKTIQKGWINTGDLGRYDEDGFLWFVGRRKDVIVSAGNKIAPLEVEAALLDHPAVREACVIGVPDPTFGEAPHAYVILEPGDQTRPEALRSFVAGRLAEFMVPAEVHVITEMPSKGPGKVDRELLRMRAITAALIEQVPFFKHANAEFLRDIIPRLDARQFSPGEILVHVGACRGDPRQQGNQTQDTRRHARSERGLAPTARLRRPLRDQRRLGNRTRLPERGSQMTHL